MVHQDADAQTPEDAYLTKSLIHDSTIDLNVKPLENGPIEGIHGQAR